MTEETESNAPATPPTMLRDLMVLTKFRLSAMVIVSTFVGFWLRHQQPLDGWLLFHTILGSTLAAFGAAVFNQLMEVEPDSKMIRTSDRPLPSGRISSPAAFALGWMLSALALIHLSAKVNIEAAGITALTLATYLFVYTPLKQTSAANTLVGAVSGALPPLIGWMGAVGQQLDPQVYFRWAPLFEPGAIYLFLLLFVWQLPHFLAINWMYRDEYQRGGFVMLANDDDEGRRTSLHALGYAVATVLLMFYPVMMGAANWWFLLAALPLSGWLCGLAWRFRVQRDRASARKLFFATLAYLPLILLATVAAWRR